MGFDPRAQWDSTRGPEPFDREWRPIRRLNRRSNRLFSRLFDHASHGPVEPRCAHHTTPRSAHTSPNTVECKGHRPQNRLLNAVLGECGPRRRALPLEGLLWPLFEQTLARIVPIENQTLARIKPSLGRTPRYWFARAPRARYWLMRAVREWPCTRGV